MRKNRVGLDRNPASVSPFESTQATLAPFQTFPAPVTPQDSQRDDVVAVEMSIVMPCLDERETVGSCVRKAQDAIASHGIKGEVIVADNGSTDGSVEIARAAGARVLSIREKGYGNALMGGIEAARGGCVVIGDADDSYDFGECPRFLESLRTGNDVVLGNRFRGKIHPGAMPWHHRFVGNPMLTRILNIFFGTTVGDVHCGMRAITKQAYRRINLRTTGMEFASEMVVKAAFAGMRIGEVPISYRPAGRTRRPHLRSFRDGWRHLRFLLLYAPGWLFMLPGFAFLGLGLALNAALFFGPIRVGATVFDVHTMIFGALLALLGFQILSVGAFAKTFALTEQLLPGDTKFEALFERFTLEWGLTAGAVVAASGLGFLIGLFVKWYSGGFGPLDVDRTLRPAIIGMVLIVLGIQTIFSSFFMSMLGLKRREPLTQR